MGLSFDDQASMLEATKSLVEVTGSRFFEPDSPTPTPETESITMVCPERGDDDIFVQDIDMVNN